MTTDPSTPHERGRRHRGGDFRPDIEGLRAVAILAVVAYHAGLSIIPGGYVGVDVFFVISGFLITDHLVRELAERGGVAFGAFYARRARRLLPSALLVIGVTVAVSCVVLPPLQAMAVAKDGLANAFYVGNYRYALQATNYLSASGPVSPLLNYWSLGVEEQFYLRVAGAPLGRLSGLVATVHANGTGPAAQDPAPVLDRLRGDGAPGDLLPGLFDLVDSSQRALGLLLAPNSGLGTGRRGPPGPRCPPAWPTAGRWGISCSAGRDRGHRLFGRHLHVGHPVPGRGRPRPGGRRRRGGRRRLRPPPTGRGLAAPPPASSGHRARLVHLVPLALAGIGPRSLDRRPPIKRVGQRCRLRPRLGAGRRNDDAPRAPAPAGFMAGPAPAEPPPDGGAERGSYRHHPALDGSTPFSRWERARPRRQALNPAAERAEQARARAPSTQLLSPLRV